MTQAEALEKAAVLMEIVKDSIDEFRALNSQFGLGLELHDYAIINDVASEVADENGWNSSNCY